MPIEVHLSGQSVAVVLSDLRASLITAQNNGTSGPPSPSGPRPLPVRGIAVSCGIRSASRCHVRTTLRVRTGSSARISGDKRVR